MIRCDLYKASEIYMTNWSSTKCVSVNNIYAEKYLICVNTVLLNPSILTFDHTEWQLKYGLEPNEETVIGCGLTYGSRCGKSNCEYSK